MVKHVKTLFGIALRVFTLVMAVSAVHAQSQNLVYVDSVVSGAGQDVIVKFSVRNTDSIASLSIPITYDTSILKIKSLSFAGSRIEYLGNKITSPSIITNANGHFIVAAFRITEKALAPGDGAVFSAVFTISQTAVDGNNAKIDSLFYPPGGNLLLVKADSARSVRPSFRAGNVLISSRPPVFATISDQSTLEGDSLRLDVVAIDPNGRPVTLALINKPIGAKLIDNGNGTGRIIWAPDYVGPNSSDMSPFTFGVRATNGTASTDKQVHVVVINRDRAPIISAISTLGVQAGQPISFSVSATDADFDPISWSHTGLPVGATFDNENPGTVSWSSAITDSGSREIRFIAADPFGFSDTALVTIHVAKTIIFGITLDTVSAESNTTVDYYVRLDNKMPVSSYRVLFNYDPSVLTLLSVSKVGTRSGAFPVFDVSTNVGEIAGNTRIVGNVNGPGQTTNAPLGAGNGPIAKLSFRISGNIMYAGQYLPVRFQFLDPPVNNDNTMTDSTGAKIEQGQITYSDGSVQIKSIGAIKIGDINLNGLAYEISDVIYFTNFFISPGQYPFNAIQYANSDVNGDHLVATIADLVTLINVILGGNAPRLTGEDPAPVELSVAGTDDSSIVSSNCVEPIGGLLMTLEVPDWFELNDMTVLSSELTSLTSRDGNTLRILMYDMNGRTLPSGVNQLVQIPASATVKEVMASSSGGQLMTASIIAEAILPSEYTLSQNYPNPFNPETNIDFALPSAARIRLTIFNLLGQEISALVDGDYPSGAHTITWRGIDTGGRAVASGMYFYRLETPAGVLTRKMMLLK